MIFWKCTSINARFVPYVSVLNMATRFGVDITASDNVGLVIGLIDRVRFTTSSNRNQIFSLSNHKLK